MNIPQLFTRTLSWTLGVIVLASGVGSVEAASISTCNDTPVKLRSYPTAIIQDGCSIPRCQPRAACVPRCDL